MKLFLCLLYINLVAINYILFVTNRKFIIVEIVSICFLLLVMGGNTFCADFEDYESWYEGQDYPIIMEPGYIWLTNIFHSYGFSFIEFRLTYFAFSFLIAIFALRRLNINCHLIIFYYLLFAFILDAIQIRNTMGISFLLLGVSFLADRSRVKYIICLLCAILFHYSFAIFIPLLFYKSLNKYMRKYQKTIVLVSIGLSIVALNGHLMNRFINIVDFAWGESKTQYFSSSYIYIAYLLIPLSMYYVSKKSWVGINIIDNHVYDKCYADVVLAICTLLVICMPLFVMSHDFIRISRDVGIEVVAVVALIKSFYKRGIIINKCVFNRRIYILSIFFLFTIWMVLIQYWPGYSELFNNNIIYKLFS